MSMREMRTKLAELAAYQNGMFTAVQATCLGATGNRLARGVRLGRLERIASGVYKFAGTPPIVYEDTYAAWLAAIPAVEAWKRENTLYPNEAVVAAQSALELHGLTYHAYPKTCLVTTHRHRTRARHIYYCQRNIAHLNIERIDGMPVMTLEDALADMYSLVPDADNLGTAIDMLAEMGKATAPALLRQAFARHPRTTLPKGLDL